MAKTRTSTEVKRRYNEKTYTKIGVDVPKETAVKFREKCERTGTVQRQILLKAIENFLRE